jgi:hypothetical protein
MWQRAQIGISDTPCGLCASDAVAVMESTELRTGLARLNPRWRPAVRSYHRCQECGARQNAEALQDA